MPIVFVLKDTLWDLHMKQKEAAKKCGIPENTMSNLCRGDVVRLPLDQIGKLCEGLGIQVEKVIQYVPDQ